MRLRILLPVLLAWTLALLPSVALSQDKAQLPYAMVSQYQDLFDSLAHLEQIVPSMMVSSVNREVSPEQIEFKISTDTGWETFNPQPNSQIEFPRKPEWADRTFLSNQPKGTLQLVIGFSAKRIESKEVAYQDLMGLVNQFNEAMVALAKMQSQPPPKVTGLTIQLTEESGAAVHIQSQKRKQTLKSNKAGVVVMKFNQGLWQENPPVVFDELPIGIIPLQGS